MLNGEDIKLIILGISAFYHDSAAALMVDGKILAAAQEERFTRKKHDSCFPIESISYCIKEAGIDIAQIDHVVFYDQPLLKFSRIFETYLSYAPVGFSTFAKAFHAWIMGGKLFQKKALIYSLCKIHNDKNLWAKKIIFSEHHLSHASSAFFPSPFPSAAILTIDGVGEWATTSIYKGVGNNIVHCAELQFPHSLGLLYSAFTYFCGFKVNSGEYKLMGLAPYGVPRYVKAIKDNLIFIQEDGSFRLNMEYFSFCTKQTMTSNKFNNLFGGQPRKQESQITQREMDLAASIQVVTEELVCKLAKNAKKITGEKYLCLAGGVALNCVANGKLIKEKVFDSIWVQPAAGDAGGALGAAMWAYYMKFNNPRVIPTSDPGAIPISDAMQGAYLGPKFSTEEVIDRIRKCNAVFQVLEDNELVAKTAMYLAEGKAVGWMSGRMEFGPRALGARSILADPRSPSMQKILNLKIKFRESFRPFAPSVLGEDLSEWFELDVDSPYMLFVANIKDSKKIQAGATEDNLFGIDKLKVTRSLVPAITHVDYSARIQTVHRETNPRYYDLINKFKALTGCPILINTSFNVRGEPIVCTPEDAFRCFMGTGLDVLVIENVILLKENQMEKAEIYYSKFDSD